jgi:hypothetical protein
MIDGNGVLHPRGFGLASHFGVLADIPTIGVAKTYARTIPSSRASLSGFGLSLKRPTLLWLRSDPFVLQIVPDVHPLIAPCRLMFVDGLLVENVKPAFREKCTEAGMAMDIIGDSGRCWGRVSGHLPCLDCLYGFLSLSLASHMTFFGYCRPSRVTRMPPIPSF